MGVRRLLDRLQVARSRDLGAKRLHHYGRHLAAVFLQQPLHPRQVAVGEGYGGASQHPGDADGLYPRKWKLTGLRVGQVVSRLVPVVPAVIPGE